MSGSRANALTGLYQTAIRIFMGVLGISAVAWGTYTLPVFWRQAPIEHIAISVIEGHRFKTEALAALIPAVQAIEKAEGCRPAANRAAAIIRLRLAENSISAGQQDNIDSSLNLLRNSIRQSLSCSPADSFLWLVLFWVENTINGFSRDNLEYLRMSYHLGPNEGWIGLKRNRLALAVFEQLPGDLAEMAITEFAALLNSGFHSEMVEIFTGPGWHVRDQLLPRLKGVAELNRQAFASSLYKQGYDVAVPSIKSPDPRPWH